MALLLLMLSFGLSHAVQNKLLFGYVEKVILPEKNLTLSAKLDTGAKSASLSATHIEAFEEKGKTFLKFEVPTKYGHYRFKAELMGEVRIKLRSIEKQKAARAASLKRPMIKMRVKLGQQEKEIVFNLTNRKRFNYPVLLGRDALIAFDAIIDPASAFLGKKNIHLKLVENHVKTK